MTLQQRDIYYARFPSIAIVVLCIIGIGHCLVGCDQTPLHSSQPLSELPYNKDVRVTYSLMPADSEWQTIDRLELAVDSIMVNFIETELGCDDNAYLDTLAGKPLVKRRDGPRVGEREQLLYPTRFHGTPSQYPLVINPHDTKPILQLRDLNRLPNGFISELRLKTSDMRIIRNGEAISFEPPAKLRTQGLLLKAKEGLVPVCNRYITNINFVLRSNDWLADEGDKPKLFEWIASNEDLAAHLTGTATAPKAVYPKTTSEMQVPGEISVTIPNEAVTEAMVVRVSEIEKAPQISKDYIFNKLMKRIGQAYDIKPDGFMFQRPISISLPVPMKLGIPTEPLDDLENKPVPTEMIDCLRDTNAQLIIDAEKLRHFIFDCVNGFSDKGLGEQEKKSLAEGINDLVEPMPVHAPESMALYTWSPAYRLWLPDVPRLLEEHEQLVINEFDRVIAAEASNPSERFKADFSTLPAEVYGRLDLDRINNQLRGKYLVTSSNHFCIKSLFADLNLSESDNVLSYRPLLDGALDDMCQTTDGFGFVRDDNEEVHCGGDPASEFQIYKAERQTKRAILDNGVDLRFRNNVHSFIEDLYPDIHPDAFFPELIDLENDVWWAVRVWQEAINRNPDGTWTDRFSIDCTDLSVEPESTCTGPEIDIGFREYDDTPGKSYRRNIIIDESTFNDAMNDPNDRLRLRSVILHEMGHVLGLGHWAGPGTLMSYNGRIRRNDFRYNLCAPFYSDETYPSGVVAETDLYCLEPEMEDRYGTTYEGSTNYYEARMNRLSCTDIQRIRQQINDAEIWTDTEPLRCEIMAEQTEYAALERKEYDTNTSEEYFVLEMDLRFKHCGNSPRFTRMEFELLGVDADNDSDRVVNLYQNSNNPPRRVVEIELDESEPDANGFYTVPINLDSRNLLNAATVVSGAVTTYPSFSEYMEAEGFPSLAMVIRTYAESDDGGYRDEFIAGSTGLLRSPLLTPIDVPITFGLSALTLGGQEIPTDHPLLLAYPDYVSSEDVFPHTDSALKKPNVGRVLYIVLPPQTAGSSGDYEATFTWNIPAPPDGQYASWTGSPMRIWVDSVEVSQEDVPTIEDWGVGGSVSSNIAPVNTETYTNNASIIQDPCQHLTGATTLLGTVTEGSIPLRIRTADNGNEVNAWDLFHFKLGYDYIPYQCSSPPCASTDDVCDSSSGYSHTGSLTGNRTQDFFVNISGPTGAIIEPSGSRCLIDTHNDPSYMVKADVRSLKRLNDFFQSNGIEYQVRIIAQTDRARKEASCKNYKVGGTWIDLAAIEDDGQFTMTGVWKNNCLTGRYTVDLQYRYRTVGDEQWSDPITLDTETVKVDYNSECSDNNNGEGYDSTCLYAGSDSCR